MFKVTQVNVHTHDDVAVMFLVYVVMVLLLGSTTLSSTTYTYLGAMLQTNTITSLSENHL